MGFSTYSTQNCLFKIPPTVLLSKLPNIMFTNISAYRYCTWEIFGRGKWRIWQIVSYLSKFSSPIFTETLNGIYTDCSLFTKFFLTNSFYLYGLPKFSPTKYFPCTVVPNLLEVDHVSCVWHCMASCYHRDIQPITRGHDHRPSRLPQAMGYLLWVHETSS